jgi:enolase
MKKIDFKPVTISVSISAETNRLLTESASRSKRTKAIEAIIRLSESLRSVNHIEGHYPNLLNKY